jgi:hypothetical protein
MWNTDMQYQGNQTPQRSSEQMTMDKTLTPAEQALVEKLVYVLSILEGMDKRIKKIKALEERLIEETSLLCSFLNSDL